MASYRQAAVRAAKEAGEFLLAEFNDPSSGPGYEMKTGHEIVTSADMKSEEMILGILRKEFPKHDILSEEAGMIRNGKESEYAWFVDPIDGTTNFSMKNPVFCVSIALAHKGEVILGVVYNPVTRELFSAERGKGAYLNDRELKVSEREKIGESILTFCHGSREQDLIATTRLFESFKLNTLSFRQLGAAALELGFVAAGRTESIMIPGARVWDVAAGILMVREAGGKVTDFERKEWNLNSKDMLASNGRVHDELLRNIKRILKK